ncbi:MAG: hypothetical protein AMXMBFR13_05040 [Phycisphaerae bacterium]
MTEKLHRICPSYLLLLPALAAAGCGPGSIEREVVIEYVSQPEKAELLQTDPQNPIRICVSKVDVASRVESNDERMGVQTWTFKYAWGLDQAPMNTVAMSLVSTDDQQKYAKQWENLVRARLGAKLKDGAEAQGRFVTMVDRDALGVLVNEKDLKNSGIVEEDKDTAQVRQLGVDMFVFGDVEVGTHYDITYKSDMGAKIFNWLPYMPNIADESPKQHIRRTMTFAGNLRAVDAKSGEVSVCQAFSAQEFQDKKPWPLVGTSRTRADLIPEDAVVKNFLEKEVDRFVGRLVPVHFRETVLVESSSSESCRRGVELLSSDGEEALASLTAALAENPSDHEAAFAAGVALERLNRLSEASAKYQLAKDLSGAEEKDVKGHKGRYVAAVKRVSERLEQNGGGALKVAVAGK